MTNNVKFTFSVDDTTRTVYKYYWAGQIVSMTLVTIFSVVFTKSHSDMTYNHKLQFWSTYFKCV